MRRAFNVLFTPLATTSLLLCVAACVLWVRGYFVVDDVQYIRHAGAGRMEDGQAKWSLMSAKGELGVGVSYTNASGAIGPRFRWFHDAAPAPIIPGPHSTVPAQFGFHFLRATFPIGPSTVIVVTGVVVPAWFAALATAALPALAFLRLRRRRRIRWRLANGMCVRCGYDLRESAGLCPECGATPANPSPAAA